ncbi:MAG: hypothetical protein ACHQC9_03125 [Alphaproteobacteria bacterium]
MTEIVTLGERQFEVRPLKLGQLRHLLDALDEMTGKSGGALIEAAARVVTAGLAPAQPELTADTVLDLEASLEELNAAVAAVLRVAGLTPRENATGEARPVASPGDVPGNNSAPSMALSPPAAAIATPSSTA